MSRGREGNRSSEHREAISNSRGNLRNNKHKDHNG